MAHASKKTQWRILLVEEFGLRNWYWYPRLEERHLIRWFRGVERGGEGRGDPLFSRDLPGRLIQATDEALFNREWQSGEEWTGHAHTVGDSYVRSPSGETVRPLEDPDVFQETWLNKADVVDRLLRQMEYANDLEALGDLLKEAQGWFELPPGLVDRSLDLTWRRFGPGLGRLLADTVALRTVQDLNLCGNELEDADIIALSTSRHVGNLRILNLAHNALEDSGLLALAQSPLRLWVLDVRAIPISPETVEALQAHPSLYTLRVDDPEKDGKN